MAGEDFAPKSLPPSLDQVGSDELSSLLQSLTLQG